MIRVFGGKRSDSGLPESERIKTLPTREGLESMYYSAKQMLEVCEQYREAEVMIREELPAGPGDQRRTPDNLDEVSTKAAFEKVRSEIDTMYRTAQTLLGEIFKNQTPPFSTFDFDESANERPLTRFKDLQLAKTWESVSAELEKPNDHPQRLIKNWKEYLAVAAKLPLYKDLLKRIEPHVQKITFEQKRRLISDAVFRLETFQSSRPDLRDGEYSLELWKRQQEFISRTQKPLSPADLELLPQSVIKKPGNLTLVEEVFQDRKDLWSAYVVLAELVKLTVLQRSSAEGVFGGIFGFLSGNRSQVVTDEQIKEAYSALPHELAEKIRLPFAQPNANSTFNELWDMGKRVSSGLISRDNPIMRRLFEKGGKSIGQLQAKSIFRDAQEWIADGLRKEGIPMISAMLPVSVSIPKREIMMPADTFASSVITVQDLTPAGVELDRGAALLIERLLERRQAAE